jgi:hypothetical protein
MLVDSFRERVIRTLVLPILKLTTQSACSESLSPDLGPGKNVAWVQEKPTAIRGSLQLKPDKSAKQLFRPDAALVNMGS